MVSSLTASMAVKLTQRGFMLVFSSYKQGEGSQLEVWLIHFYGCCLDQDGGGSVAISALSPPYGKLSTV